MSDDQFEQAKAYNAAVVGVGYAGVFALLSYTHADMQPKERGLTALCLLVSLAVFIGWVVGDGIFQAMNGRPGRSYKVAWISALVLTIGPAIVAAGTMFLVYWQMLFR